MWSVCLCLSNWKYIVTSSVTYCPSLSIPERNYASLANVQSMQIFHWEHCALAGLFSHAFWWAACHFCWTQLCSLVYIVSLLSSALFCHPSMNRSDKLFWNRRVAPLKFVFEIVFDVMLSALLYGGWHFCSHPRYWFCNCSTVVKLFTVLFLHQL